MAKTYIISGASGNLGTAVVKQFLANGDRVIAVSSRGGSGEFAGNPLFSSDAVDLTDEKKVTEWVESKLVSGGRIDGALLLAGSYTGGGLKDTGGEDLRKMYAVNFETVYFLVRALMPHLLSAGSGRIVLVGARPALKPAQGKTAIAYALSKSLLFQLAEILNEESKDKDVVTSVVVPSTIYSEANKKYMPDADPETWVKPEQIAGLIAMICSEAGAPLRETVLKIYNKA